jgi:NADH-quinone oxidoreductase subunit I
MAARYRGAHRLLTRPDGKVKCVACMCCPTICPAKCITIIAGEDPNDPAEKFPVEFDIDMLRCIFCGFCVEACPCDAIRMDTGIHMTALDNRASFIFDKEMLMSFAGQDGTFKTLNPRHEPGDPTHPGVDRMHGGH